MDETNKRLKIIKKIPKLFNREIFEGIILTGSMVYGRHYCVNSKSDIDIIFIMNKKNAELLKKERFFCNAKYFTDEKTELLKKGVLFWCDQKIDGININMGFCSSKYFRKFCSLDAKTLSIARMYSKKSAAGKKTIERTANQKIDVKKYGNTYIWTYKLYDKGIILERPFLSNLICSSIIYNKDDSLKNSIGELKQKIAQTYDIAFIKNLLRFVYNKAPKSYLKKLEKELMPK